MTPEDYNAQQLAAGNLTWSHITRLVEYWQRNHGLDDDGKAGPQTIASLGTPAAAPAKLEVVDHWLTGPGVTRIAAHTSWYGGPLTGNAPRGIVAHYTATDPGTAVNMANRRTRQYGADPDDRLASWHITIETDGSVVVMVPLDHAAWHAGSDTALPVPGLGKANYTTVGIELVGYGKAFPPAQVESAGRVWRALVQRYGIKREHAMITHQSIDPTRREDPGPVWMQQHAPGVLDAAFG